MSSCQYGNVQPPCANPPSRSSSSAPGACITPSNVTNSETISFLMACSCSYLLALTLREFGLLTGHALTHLGGHRLAEVFDIPNGTDLDDRLPLTRHRIGAAPHPFERFVHRLHLPDPVAGDALFGLREGPDD